MQKAADEIERLRAGGCARDQRTTQFCAEAVALEDQLRELSGEAGKLREERDGYLDGKRLLTAGSTVEIIGQKKTYTRQPFLYREEHFEKETGETNSVEIWVGRVMVWNFEEEKPDLSKIIDSLDRNDFTVYVLDGDSLKLAGEIER
jgi:hypothetical protein